MSTAKIELLRQTQIHYFSCYDKYYELYEKETNTHSTAKLQLKCISTKNIVFEESYTFSLNKQTNTHSNPKLSSYTHSEAPAAGIADQARGV